MTTRPLARHALVPVLLAALVTACERPDPDAALRDSLAAAAVPDTATRTMPVTYASYNRIDVPVTLPVLDAFLNDTAFVAHVRARLALTDAQVDSLRLVAREETSRLNEGTADEYTGSTWAARELAASRLTAVLGQQKATDLMAMVRYYWSDAAAIGSDTSMTFRAGDTTLFTPNNVPTDTRIVVNAPAYRMDVFENGKLVKTYKIGIGYPEFPLPIGIRTAERILFNPTWTPPDEPWVEGSGEVKVGQTVPAGSKLNPLGVAKIPIGLPSLIHGGKSAAQLGGFASHGCVGLTDAQMRDFSLLLAKVGGADLTPAMVRQFGQNRKVTKDVALNADIPVELRYETIVLQDGALHILRDVYGYGNNSEERLEAVLSAHGVTIDQLSPAERTQVTDAIREMSAGVPTGASVPTGRDPAARPATDSAGKATGDSVTRTIKGRKAVVVPVAAFAGKGYPAPVTQ